MGFQSPSQPLPQGMEQGQGQVSQQMHLCVLCLGMCDVRQVVRVVPRLMLTSSSGMFSPLSEAMMPLPAIVSANTLLKHLMCAKQRS